jgi:hypothetical protein
MGEMRARGQGTWDRTTNSWRLKARKISKSPRQLEDIFGEVVPRTKEGSRPYWNRFLKAVKDNESIMRKQRSPLQERIKSLEVLIAQFQQEGRDVSFLTSELERCCNVTPADTDHVDFPILHPDMEATANLLGVGDDELSIRVLNSLKAKPIPKKDSLRNEAEVYIANKNGNDRNTVRGALQPFLDACGDIRIQDITIHHYRDYLDKLKQHPKWNDTSKAMHQRRVLTFLRQLRADHDLKLGFIDARQYRLPIPDGKKYQWTLAQVQTALQHAQGLVRTSILLGLNCGSYWGDIASYTTDNVKDNHLVAGRAKLEHRSSKTEGSWLLWPETKQVLDFGHKQYEYEYAFRDFKEANNLPEHKALRKTTAQWIQDKVGEEEARLFRCEAVRGCHGKNYIRSFTPDQVAKLDSALERIHRLIFGS